MIQDYLNLNFKHFISEIVIILFFINNYEKIK
jgi:hypothetical protein